MDWFLVGLALWYMLGVAGILFTFRFDGQPGDRLTVGQLLGALVFGVLGIVWFVVYLGEEHHRIEFLQRPARRFWRKKG